MTYNWDFFPRAIFGYICDSASEQSINQSIGLAWWGKLQHIRRRFFLEKGRVHISRASRVQSIAFMMCITEALCTDKVPK